MKRIFSMAVIMLAVFFIFTLPAAAEENEYEEQYEASGAGNLFDSLTNEAKEFFSSFEVDLSDPKWVDQLTTTGVFERIFNLIRGSFKNPARALGASTAILLLAAAISSLSPGKDDIDQTIKYVCMIGICICVVLPVCGLIGSVVSALKGSAVFILSFIPVYAGILTVSGHTAVASSSFLLLGSAEAVSSFVSFGLTPLVSSCLSISLASSVSPLTGATDAVAYLKKIAFWGLSAAATVFTGVLSVQTVIASAADNLTMKTAKLFTSSVVPVVGAALGESLTTVASCFAVLKTSVGIFGVVAMAAIVLPILLEIVLWRIAVMILSLLSSFLGFQGVCETIKAADSALSFLAAAILLISAMFIIGLTVVVMAGGKI